MPVLACVIIAIAAYLLGSIPTGYLVARAKGVDIRAAGSGNIGATNALRVLGKPAGIFVLLMDVLKGYAAVAWVCVLLMKRFDPSGDDAGMLRIVAGIGAVLGHNYTCWLGFKGGKGVATTAGVYLALAPLTVGIGLAAFLLALLTTRYVSVGSMAAAVALPVAVWCTQRGLLLDIVTTALGVMVIYKHKSNLKRLLAGTENRLGGKTSTPEATK